MPERLIDANAFLKDVLPECKYPDALREAVEIQPTIEAEPVRHGRWMKYHTDYGAKYYCSVCCINPIRVRTGELFRIEEFVICPFCGARMDGGADNAE